MRGLVLALTLTASGAQADVAVPVTDIAGALVGRTLDYAQASQMFFGDGTTEYAAGRPSLGFWEVRSGQYCSNWPPAKAWVCFDVFKTQQGRAVLFTGPDGELSEGVYRE